MRRILLMLLIAILSVPIAWADETGGATVVRAEYFFDSDPGYGNATIINNVTEGDNNLSLSVERLLPGAHMLYVRSQASTGVWSSTQSHPLLILRQRPTEAVRVEYFYDTDPGYGNGKSVGNLTDGDNTLVVSVAGLAYGVHHLCLRAQDNTGVWSQVATSSVFVTSPQTANAIRVEYFFDTDPGFGQGTPITPSQDETATYALSLDGLSMGAHVLNLRVQDNHGRWSAVQQHPIYVLSNLPDIVAAEYFFDDNDPGEGQATAVPLPNVKTDPFAFEANTAGLAPGEHHLMVRLKKNNGFWTLYDAATFTVEGPVEPEHYAVLTDNTDVLDDPVTGITYGKTLMFYYDTEKQARAGMSVGPFADSSERGWSEQRKAITSVVFDESFANDTTLTSTSYWFSGLEKLTTITNMQYLNTARVTDMNHMFMYCDTLKQIDLANFNTANVINMNSMFYGCTRLEQLDLTRFNTEKVTDMSNMFSFCEGLLSVDLSSFNTAAVTTMEAMFNQCISLETLDVRNFDTHNVKDMSWMFNQLKAVSNLDLTHFNTENVTNMYCMFSECNSMSVIDLSSFNTLKVENMTSMFHTNPLLKTIFVGDGWTTENVVDGEWMFVDCPNLVGGKGTAYDSDHTNKAYAHIDGGRSNPGYLTDKNAPAEPEHYAVLADNDIVIYPEGAALPGKTLTFFFDTKKAERSGMSVGPFDDVLPEWSQNSDAITLVVFDESFANDTTLTSTANWFTNCRNLSSIEGIKNLNTAKVTDMHSMFESCSALIGLDMSGFNTTNVENVAFMFYGCSSLANLEFDNFNVANVWNMKGMFIECTGLTSLDLSTFNTAQVSYMDEMFRGCSNLTTIYVGSGWNTDNVNLSDNMFLNCTKLVGGKGTVFDADHIDKAYAHIDGGASNPGYLTDKNAPAEPEHYAVLADNDIVINPEGAALPGKTLTFFYDTKKAERSGMSVGPFDLPQNREWESLLRNITTVQFDESMANDTTVTSTAYWFYGCQNLEYVYGTENLKTQNVTDMKYMFYDCNVLQEVNLIGFNTANVTDMTGMFYKCHSLQTIDLTNFNTSKVTNMSWMFYNCSAVTKIYAGSYWTTTAVRESEDMFVNCTHVVGSAGTTYDANYVDAAYAHIDGGPSNPGYLSDKNAPAIAEAYAVLSEDNTVLTFYYDTEKQARNGMDIGPFATAGDRQWTTTPVTVIFDDSFANDTTITSTAYWFDGFTNLTEIKGLSNLHTNNVTDMKSMFSACQSLSHIELSHFDTGKVTNMESMFWACGSLMSLEISGFNTSNVTDMSNMFYGCGSLTSLEVSGFNTAKVSNMSSMFGDCFKLTNLDLSKFKTDSVTSMREMFYRCYGLTTLDISGFNTAKVKDMYEMFYQCRSLTTLDVSDFNTAEVTNMESMFAECSVLTSLDLSNFNTAKVEYMQNMFHSCEELTTIYASDDWVTTAVTWGPGMFSSCYKLVGGKGTTYDSDHVDYTYAHIDGGPSNPGYFTDKNATPAIAEAYAVLSDNNTVLTFYYDTEKLVRGGMDVGPFSAWSARGWHEQCESIKNVVFDASFANDTTLTSTAHWFYGCRNLTAITGISNLRTDNVRYMRHMFRYCTNLTELDVRGFNTGNVEDMRGLFSHCSSLTNLDVSGFKTDNVTDMMSMFDGCTKLTSIDVSHFKTEKVTNLSVMFQMCPSLTSLDLSNFNTSNVTNTQGMFYGCSNLVTLDVRNFDMSKVNNEEKNMFTDCSYLACVIAGNAEIPAEEYAQIQNPNLLVYVNEPSLAPQGVQNVVVNGVAKEIVLTDEVGSSDNNNFYVPQSFTAERITYTRNFAQQTQPDVSRGWESISLPFSVQNIVHESKGGLVPFGSSAEGKKFWLRRLADNGLTRAYQIEANVPYVISMPNSTEYTDLYNLAGRVTFSAENTTVPATTPQTMSLSDGSIDMVPTMLRVSRSSRVWALNVGEVRGQYLEGSVFERDYRMVRPFQAYTVHHSNSPAPRFVPINKLMDGDATPIDELVSPEMSGDSYYTLDGRKLDSKPITKGVYIRNGRKVVVGH